jgi:hypothetical protein
MQVGGIGIIQPKKDSTAKLPILTEGILAVEVLEHGDLATAIYFVSPTGRRWRARDHFSSSMPWPVTAEMA